MSQLIRRRMDELLLSAIIALSAAAVLTIAVDSASISDRQQANRQFQMLVGGLGMGPQANLAHCSWQFDPRLMTDDDGPLGVVLGEHEVNPWHGISLFPVSWDLLDDSAQADDSSSAEMVPSPGPDPRTRRR